MALPRSPKTRLLIGVALVNVFVYVLAAAALYQSRMQYVRRAELSSQNLVRSLEQTIVSTIDKADIHLLAIVSEAERQLATGNLDAAVLNAYLRQHQEQFQKIDAFRLANAGGDVLYGSTLPAGRTINIEDRDYFRQLRDNPQAGLVFSPPLVSRITAKWSIFIARRFNHPGGNFGGVAYVVVPLDYFNEIMSGMDLGQQGVARFQTLDFLHLAQHPRTAEADRLIGSTAISPTTRQRLLAAPNAGTFTTTSAYDRVERTVSYRRTNPYPFYLYVGLSTGEYLAPWHKESAVVLALTLLFSLITAFGARSSHQRRMAEARDLEALRRSERRLFLAISATADAVWEWNLHTNETYYSPRWYEMLGYADRQFPMDFEAWKALCHPDDLQPTIARIELALSGPHGTGYVAEFRMRNADGSWVWILGRGNVVERDPEGRPTLLSGTNTDITERKRAEEEREKLQLQLVQAQKMESVGRLAGGVAHDFNNMLGVIIGHAEMALEQAIPDNDLHAHLDEIKKAAQRSADVTRQLLAFARKQTVTPKVLDINETVEGMLKLLRRLIGEDIDLAWRPGRNLWTVKMDPAQLDQILANLCVNARGAITGVGKVTIETDNVSLDEEYCDRHAGFTPGDYVLLAVSDDGCGMDAETRSHIFEPFFTTKEAGKGTGLGLATVYGAIKQNDGFVNVCSEPGQGATFTLYLPRHAAKAETETETETKEPEPQPAARGSETILLVEDEPAVLRMTRTALERFGYTVLAAPTPGEAIRLAAEHSGHIDLVISDVVMPEMNGRELVQNLLATYPDIRRLFMSGYTANIIAHHGVLNEDVHFIQKPFLLDDLAAKIREALE